MIYYNLNTINDWNFGDDNIIKVYKHGAVCYYKITSGDTPTPVQEPCFAVVDDITQYQDTEFEDVFNKADGKWYKLNNLDEYEEYGVYGSGRTITTYDGKLTIDEEITPSRLPAGYTEVEYIQNTGTSYINTGVYLYDTTTTSYEIEAKISSSWHNSEFEYLIATEGTSSPYNGVELRWNRHYQSGNELQCESVPNNAVYSNIDNGDGTSAVTITCSTTQATNNVPLSLFCGIWSSGPWRNGKGKFYTFKVTKNDILVIDLVPCKRDSDDKYGMYDIVNDVFYLSPNNVDFSGGEPIAPTKTYEYIYSGGSWVNVGEVSGSTIDTVWIDPPNAKNQNASFDIGHYWGEGYKMVFNAYLSGSYSGDYGSFWRCNQHTPIEFSFYSNGFFYDFHNPTSTTAPNVNTRDYSWRIMKNNTLRNYENNQIFNVILTNGTVSVKLEETGAEIVNGSTSVSTQSWYNGLYQASLGSMNNQSKCHLSHIQVYNANDELVNDIKFVKNQGVTGAQEISAYDSVLNVTYNNTNSYTPSYHIVSDSGGTTYPMYYDEIQDPPNNVSFSSMTEAEEYECPWVGMTATIDGVRYVFSGDSQSGYEWVYNPSRLPQGYTEVKYVQNTGTSYFDTNFKPNTNTRIVADMQQVTANDFPRLFGCNNWNNTAGMNVDYEGGYLQISWFGKTSWSTITSIPNNFDRHVYDLNKNNLYVDETLVASTTYSSSYQSSDNLGIFFEMSGGRPGQAAYFTQEVFKGKMYSFQIYDNGTLVRDLVPCIKDSDNTVGAYDIVNDVFYTVPTGYTTDKLVAGGPV